MVHSDIGRKTFISMYAVDCRSLHVYYTTILDSKWYIGMIQPVAFDWETVTVHSRYDCCYDSARVRHVPEFGQIDTLPCTEVKLPVSNRDGYC